MIFTTDLSDFLVPKINDYIPDFGTMKESGCLTTKEVNANIMYPLLSQRGFIVTETSQTSDTVVRDSKFIVRESGITLTIGSGIDGITVRVFNKSSGDIYVVLNGTTYTLSSGNRLHREWIDDAWVSKEDIMCPIGMIYTQFPNQLAPWELWTFTAQEMWELQDYNGAFFRATGGNASEFNSGVQDMMIQSHNHTFNFVASTGGKITGIKYSVPFARDGHSYRSPQNGGNTDGELDYWGNSPTGGIETRPVNQTIQIWKRIA